MKYENPTIRQMYEHRTVRKYLKKPVEPAMLEAIIGAGQTAPTSSFLQPYSIIAVTKQETKNKLAKLCGNQEHIAQCSVFLVFCIDMQRAKQICDKNNHKVQTKYLEAFLIAVEDTAIFAQNTTLAAESFGLGTVCIGGVRNETDDVIKLLKMPKYTFPLQGLCIGYPAESPSRKVRLPLKTVLHKESYDVKKVEPSYYLEEYDQQVLKSKSLESQGKGATNWGDWIVRRTAERDTKKDPYILKKIRADLIKSVRSQGFDIE